MADAPRGGAADHVEMFGCRFDRVDMSEAIARIEGYIRARDRVYQSVGLNVDQLLKFKRDPDFARIVSKCDLITADGTPVVWFSRLFGDPLPERVASVDIMFELLPVAARKGYRVFMLGATEESVQAAAAAFRKRYPGLRIVGIRNGYFSEDEEPAIVDEINRSGADILFIAISSPKKELFVERARDRLRVPFVLGVGGAFDIAAGLTSRAPKWMRPLGIEWTWRAIQEPRRMGRRYLKDFTFARYVVAEAVQRIRSRRRTTG